MQDHAQFNPMDLRRVLLDIDRHSDTVIANLSNMPASRAGRYAVGAVKALQKLAHDGLRQNSPPSSQQPEDR